MEENEFETSDPVTPPKSERQWAMGCHLIALCGYLIPIASIIAPLILWLMKREDGPFIDEQGKESLNFQISWSIYMFCAAILIIILIGIPILIILGLVNCVLIVVAAIRANDGGHYKYPFPIHHDVFLL